MPSEPAPGGPWIREAVLRYEQPLVQYAARLLHDVDLARDVVQDTFLRLCDQSPEKQTELRQRLAPWLYTVCRNRAFELMRKDRRMAPLTREDLALRPDATPPPSAPAEQADDTAAALRAIADLPEKQQEVIRLKFQHGMTYREIAEVTGHSIGNVGFLVHTGLKNLRRHLTTANA